MNCPAAALVTLQARVLLFLSCLFLFLCGGCLPVKKTFTAPLDDLSGYSQNTPRLSCFLTLKDNRGPKIRLEIASLEVLADDLWLPVTSGPILIDTATVDTGQLYLGSSSLPSGSYKRLRLMITKGEIKKADGTYAVITGDPFLIEVPFTSILDLKGSDRRPLLISWDVQNSIQHDTDLTLSLTVSPPSGQLLVGLLYVACPDIDTVFVVRADKNWVVDSFGLRGGPTYLALDPDRSRQRLYVLASREGSVKVVDLSTHKLVDSFPATLNDAPTFMTIRPDGRGAYLLDEVGGYIDHINLITGQSIARVYLGYRPSYAAYLVEQDLLAVSSSLSQKVLLLDPETLALRRSILTGSNPQGLDTSEKLLYVAEGGDNTVSITDLEKRGSQSRLTVGFNPRRVLTVDDQIYVSNYQDGSLSVLISGQVAVFWEISGVGRPLEMAYSVFYGKLYVTDEENAAFHVVDINVNQLLRSVSLGAKPFGLAVIQ